MNGNAIEPVDVSNFYSVVNGVIMALAGFNYLALVYQNFDSKGCVKARRVMRRTPRETKRHYMKVWVATRACCEA